MKNHAHAAAASLALLVLVGCQDFPTTSAPTPPPVIPTAPPSTDVRTGWVYGPGGGPMEVTFAVHDGWAILQGDINLGRAASIPATREELVGATGGARRGITQDGSSYRWPGGVVPYVIGNGFNYIQQQAIIDGLNMVSSRAGGVQFVARTNQSAYVVFTLHSSICDSPVGRQGGMQTINLTQGCAYNSGTVAHEVLHTLGMWHEQSRCDRDTYITVHLNNVLSVYHPNFAKLCSGTTSVFDYDEGSIMHYDDYDYSYTSQPSITSNRGLAWMMGQRDSLSQIDASTVNWMYRPYAPSSFGASYPSNVPTLTWAAYPYAVQYEIRLATLQVEDYYEYGYSSFGWSDLVGYTSSTSLLDSGRSYSGNNICELWNNSMSNAWQEYSYEVYAHLPNGIVSHAANIPAFVGAC